jgi:translation initiation factor IF-3
LVSPDAKPPVAKLVDFGQFRYEQQKKEKIAKKSGKNHVLKELKLSPKISEHDYQVRISSGRKFLTKGYKIKVSVFFKGREMAHPEIGREILSRYIQDVSDLGQQEADIIRANRSMLVIINPK